MRNAKVLTMVGCLAMVVAAGCSDDSGGDSGGEEANQKKDAANGGGGNDAATGGGGDAAPSTDGNGGGGDTGGFSPSPSDFETVDCSKASPAETVTVGPGLTYTPSTVTISQGKVVKWEWDSNVSLDHNVIGSDDCSDPKTSWFESQTTKSSSATFCVKFKGEPGTYGYQCTVQQHCQGGMKGTVEVTK